MHLSNKTWIPDPLMRRLLVAAGRVSKCKVTQVPIRARLGVCCRGMAYRRNRVYPSEVYGEGTRHRTRIECNGGYILLVIPNRKLIYRLLQGSDGYMGAAEMVFSLMIHEYAHVADYQYEKRTNILLPWSHKERHDNRPQERRCIAREWEYANNIDGAKDKNRELMQEFRDLIKSTLEEQVRRDDEIAKRRNARKQAAPKREIFLARQAERALESQEQKAAKVVSQ